MYAEMEAKIVNAIVKERLEELSYIAKQTKCYDYFDRLLECESLKDIAEFILFLGIVSEESKELELFRKKVKNIYKEVLLKFLGGRYKRYVRKTA